MNRHPGSGKKLADIQEHLGGAEALKKKIIVVESDGTPTVRDLAYLVKQVEKDQRDQIVPRL